MKQLGKTFTRGIPYNLRADIERIGNIETWTLGDIRREAESIGMDSITKSSGISTFILLKVLNLHAIPGEHGNDAIHPRTKQEFELKTSCTKRRKRESGHWSYPYFGLDINYSSFARFQYTPIIFGWFGSKDFLKEIWITEPDYFKDKYMKKWQNRIKNGGKDNDQWRLADIQKNGICLYQRR